MHSDSGRSSLLHSEDESKWVEVETIALDEFIEEGIIPDVIKIDIKGAELFALSGMKKFMEKCDDLILFIEYEYNEEYISRFLGERNFKLYFITRNGELIPSKKKEKVSSSNLESNIFAIKGETINEN